MTGFSSHVLTAGCVLLLQQLASEHGVSAFVSPHTHAALRVASSSSSSSSSRVCGSRGHASASRSTSSRSRGKRGGVAPCMMAVDTMPVAMPALSSTMTEGKIVEWLKQVGDKVEAGEAVMVVESDKADMDVEIFEEGYLAKILVEEGETTSVGSACALLVKEEADIANVGDDAGGGGAVAAPAPVADAPAAAATGGGGGGAAAAKPDCEIKEISMPALSSTMTEGKVVEWLKEKGDKVEAGDAVLVVESDKADMDVESFEEGFLAAIVTEAGDSCAVGAPIGLLATTEADIPAIEEYASTLGGGGGGGGGAAAPAAPAAAAPAAAVAPPAAAPAAPPAAAAPAPPAIVNTGRIVASGYAKSLSEQLGIDLRTITGTDEGGRISARDVEAAASGGAPRSAPVWTPAPGVIAATPRARALAKSKKVDLKTVTGTGNFGRVTEDDVKAHLGMAPPAGSAAGASTAEATGTGREIPVLPDGPEAMDGMKKAVAKNMEATLDVPIFRVSRKIRTDSFDDLYRQLKPKGVTVSAMLAKACALVLEAHPIMNAKYAPGQTIYQKDINVAMAVAIEGGLITPTLKNANELSLLSLSARWRELVGKAKAKTLTADEFQSGTFTITNLGMFGVSEFAAILPPGQGTILAIGGSLPTVAVKEDGSFGVVKEMTVTITSDHRHIYGADAAMFLKDLADLMENQCATLLL